MIQTFLILSLVAGLASSLTCPDGHHCGDEDTCCKTKTENYSCCPLPNAVCCSDMLHCCPENTTCDLVRLTCVSLTTVPWMEKIPATHTGTTQWVKTESIPLVQAGTANAVTENVCLDNTECPPEYSCMPTSKGTYGCCPLTGATICKDLEHCCPKGYKCDLGKAKCKKTGFEELPLVSGVGNLRTAEIELCGNMSCSEGYTCCTSNDFGWGCCPMKNAVCCDNQCCPKGFQCDKERKTCIKLIDENVKAIICPDGESECPYGSTCCLLANEQWGCCPLEKAVCCDDRKHCCPADTRCDLKHSKCLSEYGMMEMWKKFPALRRFAMKNTEVHPVRCNETVTCPENNTCCVLATGDYGCCPLPNAVCCDDHEHCCPHGWNCTPDTGRCYQKDISIPWMTKSPALVKEIAADVKCSCQSDQTCCKNPLGEWGCCPLPVAVCCEDQKHCCPNGYTCNLTAKTCEKQSILALWHVKESQSSGVQCDDMVQCASPATCCKSASGKWACCPYKEATCCEDKMHCCPSGYMCNKGAKACTLQPRLRWDQFFWKRKRAFNFL
ncbi:granulin b isoform X2 [Hemitrygon akajei]|uniref:granulin b isoform X2 n=1 Tax=Hemitrygon akajei TaxID=2704970 RepID=UPI003BF970AC